ncbi:transcription initiation factor IID, 18kD subunit-domain-containing protein [Mucor mucedo]|uniref:transcription initiation factor IID, 18kD subunit-domain-containing protein n=1 Tax=Mucor mucedo TaxID=29922 RepID=UPI00221EC04C|nr:transcription initiation factor IID, 18kD subunit-domain-containing protein [Mucor mucedo]KAI7890337.1 transcription initiation factor IID, 18kD subunit-domain-containing protein [Mucor mucedo]
MAVEAKRSKYRFQSEIQQMMFVFGEVADPLQESTLLVEDIVRSQVIEIIIQATAQASRRSSRYLSAEDLIFLMRHDRAKVNRLRSFLSWKDVRKNAKDASGDQVEDVVEETNTGKLHRSIIKLPWELANQFSDVIVKSMNGDDESEDEDELEAYNDSIQRLKDADDVTRAMTREEYVHYSECRQASFTYRKSKRFREWANMSSFVEVKPNDDIVDSLGFLTYEMVSKLTMTAIKIKRDLMEAAGKKEDEPSGLGHKRKREDEEEATTPLPVIVTTTAEGDVVSQQQQQQQQQEDGSGSDEEEPNEIPGSPDSDSNGLFSLPSTEQTPLLPEHIYEAFRRLQQLPQPMKNFRGGLVRTRISLI